MSVPIYSASVGSVDALASLLTAGIEAGLWRWLYAEREEGVQLVWLTDVTLSPAYLATVDHARVFDNASELAWWLDEDGCVLRLCGSGHDLLPSATWQSVVAADERDATVTLLHGTWDAGAAVPQWREARLPRPQQYPVALAPDTAPQRVGLQTQPLYHPVSGAFLFDRLLAVTPQGESADDGV